MAGVAGPMLLHRHRGLRFLAGLAGGELTGSLVVGLGAYLVGTMIAAVTTQPVRLLVVCVAGVTLGVADLVGKTPQASRQVPQRLARSSLSPALLGAVWGFDLGLLLTTRKAASLSWFALTAVALLRPTLAPGLIIVMAVTTVLAVTAWSIMAGRHPGGRWHNAWRKTRPAWHKGIRSLSGASILAATATIAVGTLATWTP